MWFIQKRIPDDDDVLSLRTESYSIAKAYEHDYVGVEHVFLSFRSLPPDHSIWAVLRAFEINLDDFFSELESKARVSTGRIGASQLPHTPRLKKIFRAANHMARREGASHVTPLHLLAAVVHERGSIPAVLLATVYLQSHPEIRYDRILADTLLHSLLFPARKEPR